MVVTQTQMQAIFESGKKHSCASSLPVFLAVHHLRRWHGVNVLALASVVLQESTCNSDIHTYSYIHI